MNNFNGFAAVFICCLLLLSAFPDQEKSPASHPSRSKVLKTRVQLADSSKTDNLPLQTKSYDWSFLFPKLRNMFLCFVLGLSLTWLFMQVRKFVAIVVVVQLLTVVVLLQSGAIVFTLGPEQLNAYYTNLKLWLIDIGLGQCSSFFIGVWMGFSKFLRNRKIILQEVP